MEFISSYKPQDAIFGVANVESSHNCRLTIGYFINYNSLSLILPRTCHGCKKSLTCTREFGDQIIQKYNQRHKGAEIFFVF